MFTMHTVNCSSINTLRITMRGTLYDKEPPSTHSTAFQSNPSALSSRHGSAGGMQLWLCTAPSLDVQGMTLSIKSFDKSKGRFAEKIWKIKMRSRSMCSAANGFKTERFINKRGGQISISISSAERGGEWGANQRGNKSNGIHPDGHKNKERDKS